MFQNSEDQFENTDTFLYTDYILNFCFDNFDNECRGHSVFPIPQSSEQLWIGTY